MSSRGEKKSPLSHIAGMGMRLQHPGLPQLQQGFTHRAPQPSPQPQDPEPFSKHRAELGGLYALNSTSHPGHDEPEPLPI